MSDDIDRAEIAAPSLTPAAARVRELMLRDRVPLADFCAGIGKTPRTGYAYIAEGMPVDYIGRVPYPRLPEALDWIIARRQPKLPPPRGRGRPRKSVV
jgi:hypothetical protein